MKAGTALLALVLAALPAMAQQQEKPKRLIDEHRPGVTYEDCVARCDKCSGYKSADCIQHYCSGYERRKPGAKPLPIQCPSYGG
ncbi:hypothetical protein AOQ73_36495 [Bradyrhizobium pachyrhizi]|uniref:hypothetical protein n=1 Tax=Bradyrhizobium pachyrhizi TaxID=280333 RepID=UPI000713BAC1|nr:hypothetical protein [Bradyrhizobium pachyrhizi]KRP85977.1 hypothetical protein AOQ73_36495 [Bradyrhizobium pachyrhizi]